MLLPLLGLALCLGLAACDSSVKQAGENSDGSQSDSLTGVETPSAPDTPPMLGPAPDAPTDGASDAPGAGAGRSVQVQNDLYNFAYSYPDAAGALPGLKAMLDADLAQQQGKTRRLAQADRDASDKSAADQMAGSTNTPIPFHAGERQINWKVVADLPNWLSLSGQGYAYTGGAHGNSWFGEILWDKNTNQERKPMDLFTSPANFLNAINAPFCAALNRQRAAKRGGQANMGGTISEFTQCIDPTKETVIFGSSNGQAFDRVGILIPPYEAGPYSEGTYEVTLPVTPALMNALKPQYRASFSPAG
ncbi:DUF3298 and DUF4163 domain-containing protein [Novosphingobium sp. 9]|uniref:DUF3298 and DUF4163 domain-containing protein n=1 Tax=Novosphingobium sp. 9 TaxID=2025349 RepID=UPI0021B6B2DC|nr:DUF3298 and DUF4163 domain-containing protein [Novosphingobium sp. 9]